MADKSDMEKEMDALGISGGRYPHGRLFGIPRPYEEEILADPFKSAIRQLRAELPKTRGPKQYRDLVAEIVKAQRLQHEYLEIRARQHRERAAAKENKRVQEYIEEQRQLFEKRELEREADVEPDTERLAKLGIVLRRYMERSDVNDPWDTLLRRLRAERSRTASNTTAYIDISGKIESNLAQRREAKRKHLESAMDSELRLLDEDLSLATSDHEKRAILTKKDKIRKELYPPVQQRMSTEDYIERERRLYEQEKQERRDRKEAAAAKERKSVQEFIEKERRLYEKQDDSDDDFDPTVGGWAVQQYHDHVQ